MIKFRCPDCLETQEMVLKSDLYKSIRATCIHCGIDLYLVLVVTTQEYALKKLFEKKEENRYGKKTEEETKTKKEYEKRTSGNWKKIFKKEK